MLKPRKIIVAALALGAMLAAASGAVANSKVGQAYHCTVPKVTGNWIAKDILIIENQKKSQVIVTDKVMASFGHKAVIGVKSLETKKRLTYRWEYGPVVDAAGSISEKISYRAVINKQSLAVQVFVKPKGRSKSRLPGRQIDPRSEYRGTGRCEEYDAFSKARK